MQKYRFMAANVMQCITFAAQLIKIERYCYNTILKPTSKRGIFGAA